MAAILVPFRGAEGKRRLAPMTPEARVALGLAMLADVLSAAVAVAGTTVVTSDEAAWRVAAELEVDVLAGVPMGQGPAVEAALRRLEPVGPVLVVNADLPCVQPDDLRALLDALPPAGLAVAPAADGTTNALALADASLFQPLYGPGSAERFLALAEQAVRVDHPNLADEVDTVRFEGADEARPAPGVLEAIAAAELLLVAPSNPFVSIGPILAVAEIRAALERRRVPAVAVSPLIGGRTVRGPADRMLARLAGGTGPAQVTDCYKGLIDALVIDMADADEPAGIRTIVTRTLMRDAESRRRVAEAVLETAGAL